MNAGGAGHTDRADANSPRGREVGLAVAALVSMGILLSLLDTNVLYIDETPHFGTVVRFAAGHGNTPWPIPMWPAYHWTLVAFFRLAGLTHPIAADICTEVLLARTVTMGIGLMSVWIFYACARELAPSQCGVRTLQYLWCPTILPYFVLIFTDVFALLFVLLTFYLVLRRRYRWASVAALVSIAARQSNLVWVLFCFVYAARDAYRASEGSLKNTVIRTLPFPLCLLAAGVFFWRFGFFFNAGGQSLHKSGLFLGNVYTAMALWLVLFAPLLYAHRARVAALLRHPATFVVFLAGYGLFMKTFRLDHEMNQLPGVLTNNVLHYMTRTTALESALYVGVAAGCLCFAATPLLRDSKWLLYVAFTLFLLPQQLVVVRYDMAGIALFMLLRDDKTPPRTEAALTGLLLLESVAELYLLLYGHVTPG